MRGLRRWGRVMALVTLLAGMSAAGVKRVAVVETEIDAQSGVAETVNKAEVRQITAVLRKEAVKKLPQGKYEIMTSETVMAQGSAKLEECADENCVITLGSMIGADYIVRGTISKVGTKLTTSVDIFETENGNLVASSDLVRAGNIEELLDKTAAACAEMYKTFENGLNAVKGGAQKTQEQMTTTQTSTSTPTPPLLPPPPKPSINYGSFRDARDGKTYKTVTINRKTWMRENLNNTSSGSWCYKSDDSNCDKYGRLYDWNTAKKNCPLGFHLSSRQEWESLMATAGGKDAAGKKLKATSGWNNNGNGTDDFGFSALPGGDRNPSGDFNYAGYDGNYWTATEGGSNYAYKQSMDYDSDNVNESNERKNNGYSVRCVADN